MGEEGEGQLMIGTLIFNPWLEVLEGFFSDWFGEKEAWAGADPSECKFQITGPVSVGISQCEEGACSIKVQCGAAGPYKVAVACGGPTATASGVCTDCGDGEIQADKDEECDDGNKKDGDGCSAACKIEFCGDGKTQKKLGEKCDDGNTDDCDGCSSQCEKEKCGDGIVCGKEECDDGNTDDGDGCSKRCEAETCETVELGGGGWQNSPCSAGDCEDKYQLSQTKKCYQCSDAKPDPDCRGECSHGSSVNPPDSNGIVQASDCSARCAESRARSCLRDRCTRGVLIPPPRYDSTPRYCCKFAQLSGDCTPRQCSIDNKGVDSCDVCTDEIDCKAGSSKKLVQYDCNAGGLPPECLPP